MFTVLWLGFLKTQNLGLGEPVASKCCCGSAVDEGIQASLHGAVSRVPAPCQILETPAIKLSSLSPAAAETQYKIMSDYLKGQGT